MGGYRGWRGKGFEGDDADADVDLVVKIVKRREEKRSEEKRREEERREEKSKKPRQSYPETTQRKRDEHIA